MNIHYDFKALAIGFLLTFYSFTVFAAVPTVSGGRYHSMAIDETGQLYAWGDNRFGQLGDGSDQSRWVAMAIPNMTDVIAISGGATHSLILRKDGTVWTSGAIEWLGIGATTLDTCIGSDGLNTTKCSKTFVQVQGLTNVKAISAGFYYSLAVKSDGTIWSWGDNKYGRLGDGTTTYRATPVQITGLANVTSIATSFATSFALKEDGTVMGWGSNSNGEVGDGTQGNNRLSPVQLGISNIKSIAAGLALKTDGTVLVWGFNGYCSNGVTQIDPVTNACLNTLTPTQIPDLSNIKYVNKTYGCFALNNSNQVYGWCSTSSKDGGDQGVFGDGLQNSQRNKPALTMTNLSNVLKISESLDRHRILLTTDCKVWATGDNNQGDLGDSTNAMKLSPVAVKKADGTQLQLCKTYTNGLVAYYPLDGNGNDASGNNNHLTSQNNPLWTQGKVGQAVSLDGLSYLQKNNFNFYTRDFSVCLFANGSSVPENYRFLFAAHSGGNGIGQGDAAIQLHEYKDKSLRPTLTTEDSQGTGILRPSPLSLMEANQWYHLCFSRQGTLQKFYVNGVMTGSVTEAIVSPEFSLQNGLLEIGAPNYYQGGWTTNGRDTAKWKGLIDEVYLYNRALSDTEIVALYNKGTQPASKFKLTYNVTGFGSIGASLNLSPAGTSCGTGCMEYATGTQITVTPTFDSTLSTFSNFSSTTSSATCTANSCTLKMDKDQNVTGWFDKRKYTVSVTKTGTGKGSITGANGLINCGTTCPSQSIQIGVDDSIYIASTEDANSLFQSLQIQPSTISCGTGSNYTNCYIANIKQDISVTVDFKLKPPPIFTSCLNQTELPSAECDVLINLYNSTNGSAWSDSATNNWLKINTPCSWAGITCSNGHVTQIDVSSKNLSGSLPTFKRLYNLERFDASYNSSLVGAMPEFGNPNMALLSLKNTGLSGAIPSYVVSLPLNSLVTFFFNNTQICEPTIGGQLDGTYQQWLAKIGNLQRTNIPCTSSCSLGISNTSASQSASAGSGSFNVTNASCNWTITSNATWLKPVTTSGNSTATINYNVDANTSTQVRAGILTITAGQTTQTFSVTQTGASPAQCNKPVISLTGTILKDGRTINLLNGNLVVRANETFKLAGNLTAATGDTLKEVHITQSGQANPISSGSISQNMFDISKLDLFASPSGSYPLQITATTANCQTPQTFPTTIFIAGPPQVTNLAANGVSGDISLNVGGTIRLTGTVFGDNRDVLTKVTASVNGASFPPNTGNNNATSGSIKQTSYELSQLPLISNVFTTAGNHAVGIWAISELYPFVSGVTTTITSFSVNVTNTTSSPFKLKFPLKNYDPISIISKGKVSSYFDHSVPLINGKYAYAEGTNLDDAIINFKGEIAQRKYGFATNNGKVWSYNVSGFTLHGYKTSSGGQLFYSGHPGYDYATGTDSISARSVYAAADGTIVTSGSNGTCYCASDCGGLGVVAIQHQQGYLTCYMHMTGISAALNQQAIAGVTKLGTESNVAPQSMGIHLHFEVRKNNIPVDPYGWLGKGTDPYTRATNVWLWETPQPTPSSLAVTTLAGIGSTAAIGGGVSSDGINFLKNGIFSTKDSLIVSLTINPEQADITNNVTTRRNTLPTEINSVTDSLPEAEPVFTEEMELPEINTSRTAPEIIGNNALYIVANYEGIWFYKKGEEWKQWNGAIGNLEPYINNITLSPTEEVDVIKGLSGFAGTFLVFAGYRNTTGNIIFNGEPITFTVVP